MFLSRLASLCADTIYYIEKEKVNSEIKILKKLNFQSLHRSVGTRSSQPGIELTVFVCKAFVMQIGEIAEKPPPFESCCHTYCQVQICVAMHADLKVRNNNSIHW